MVINQRRKGKRGELEVVKFWKDLYPQARRHLEFQANEASLGIDVILDDHTGIQVKVGKNVPKWLYEVLDEIQEKDKHLCFVQAKRDRQDWVIILRAKDFKILIALLRANGIL